MFHVKHEAWTPDPSAFGLTLTPPQVEQLRAYEAELLEVAVPRGLIARSDRDRLWGRHIADGLRAALEMSMPALLSWTLAAARGSPGCRSGSC